MKKKRFSVEQIVGVLKQVEVGVPVTEMIEAWRREYNDGRPHASLADRTRSEFASQYAASRYLAATYNRSKTNADLGTRKLGPSYTALN